MLATLQSSKAQMAQECILGWIKSGKFSAGSKLPSERQLAQELGLNHQTVRRGLGQLEKAGLIEKIPRVGNFIRNGPLQEISTRVAIILPHYMMEDGFHHPYTGLVMNNIGRIFNHKYERDYLISVLSYRQGRLWEDAGQVVVNRGVKGIILVPHKDTLSSEMRKIEESNIKVVLLGDIPQLAGLGLVSISIDRKMALIQIMDRLIDLGHRRILVAEYTENLSRVEEEQILEYISHRAGIGPLKKILFNIPNKDAQIDFSVIPEILERRPRPTAVVVPDEFIAAELFRLCYQRGISVPRDISVAALNDNTPYAYHVALTAPDSVSLQSQAVELAAEYLIRMMAGENIVERNICIRCDVQWKNSVKRISDLSE